MIHLVLNDDDLLDREALAKILGLGRVAIMRAIARGELVAYIRAGKAWFLGREVKAWLRSGKHAGGKKAKASAGGEAAPMKATPASSAGRAHRNGADC